MSYKVLICKDAKRWLKIEVVCWKDCPIISKCPILIMADGTDRAIRKAMKAMEEVINAK